MIDEYSIDYDKAEQQEDGTWQAPIRLHRKIDGSWLIDSAYGYVVLANKPYSAPELDVIAFIRGSRRYDRRAEQKGLVHVIMQILGLKGV